MKNLLITFATLFVMVAFTPTGLHAEASVPGSNPAPVESADMQALKNRVQEIRAMDKSTLSRSEKKELRQELKDINKTMRDNNNGIYLSLGAIIIVILLLILLL
jgi:hypothetical protein